MTDARGRRTVVECVPARVRVFPVGRLDLESTGLLLLTNDGDLAGRLLHPRFHVEKEYVVRVRGVVSKAALEALRRGVMLEDGQTAPAVVRVLEIVRPPRSGPETSLSIVLHEGRKRQVRRMLETVGHRVVALHRTRFDGLTDAGLLPGQARRLSVAESWRSFASRRARNRRPGTCTRLYLDSRFVTPPSRRDGVPMRLNPVLEKLTPYRAGPPLAEIRGRYQLERVARLSANERPWGPFPEVIEAMKGALDGLNRYPDGAAASCGACWPSSLNVAENPAHVRQRFLRAADAAGRGLSRSGAARGVAASLVRHVPRYRSRARSLLHRGALPDLDYDLEAMLAAVQEDTSLLIICNPNNPTGSYVQGNELRAFLESVPADVGVVLDEAYGEFVTARPSRRTRSPGWPTFPNLVILRTFSKIYGLAGLRVGYGIADPQLVQALDKVTAALQRRLPGPGGRGRVAALPARVEERRQDGRRREGNAGERLDALGVACHPSEANFLLVDVTRLGDPGPEVAQALLERGILTRSGYAMDCPGWIRVTIGEAEENDMFLRRWTNCVKTRMRRNRLAHCRRPER